MTAKIATGDGVLLSLFFFWLHFTISTLNACEQQTPKLCPNRWYLVCLSQPVKFSVWTELFYFFNHWKLNFLCLKTDFIHRSLKALPVFLVCGPLFLFRKAGCKEFCTGQFFKMLIQHYYHFGSCCYYHESSVIIQNSWTLRFNRTGHGCEMDGRADHVVCYSTSHIPTTWLFYFWSSWTEVRHRNITEKSGQLPK